MKDYKQRLERKRKRHRIVMLIIAIILVGGMISVSFMSAL